MLFDAMVVDLTGVCSDFFHWEGVKDNFFQFKPLSFTYFTQ